MAGAPGVIGHIEAARERAVDASFQELGGDTQRIVEQHEARIADTLQDAILGYFRGRDAKEVSPEEIALLHYLHSGGEGLPDEEQLDPRVEAAEQALEVVAGADMLYLPLDYHNRESLAIPRTQQRKVTLSSHHIGPAPDSHDGPPYGGASISLPGLRRAHVFNLVGPEDLATPVDTAEGVDGLFKTRKSDIRAKRSIYSGPYLPVIAGRSAVSRFGVNMGTQIGVRGQNIDPNSSYYDTSFFGFARTLAELDPELGSEVIEEVRERKPKMLEAIHRALRPSLDRRLGRLVEDEGDRDDVLEWFEDNDVQLFYTPDEIQELREKVAASYRTKLEARAKKSADGLASSLGL